MINVSSAFPLLFIFSLISLFIGFHRISWKSHWKSLRKTSLRKTAAKETAKKYLKNLVWVEQKILPKIEKKPVEFYSKLFFFWIFFCVSNYCASYILIKLCFHFKVEFLLPRFYRNFHFFFFETYWRNLLASFLFFGMLLFFLPFSGQD